MSKLTKFFKHPVLFFEDAVKNKKIKEGKSKIFVVGFSTWKIYLRKYFSEYDLIFLPKDIKQSQFNSQYKKIILSQKDTCQVFIWGFKAPRYIIDFLNNENISTKYVEDGFVRSVQLGATKAPPMSLCLDSKTPYFDATSPSDLEDILNTYDFDADAELLNKSRKAIDLLLETGVSKYNNSKKIDIDKLYGVKDRKRILVLGQVEDDASIKYGCSQDITNNDVVKLARKENTDAQIIYKPHPDVMNGHRPYQSDPQEVSDLCEILNSDIPLSNALETIDHVYTITSLGGLEALIRGVKVTTIGCPFYSGWGLTDDRQENSRRKRELTIAQVFAAAYLIYPQYFDTESGDKTDFFAVVNKIFASNKDALKTHGVKAKSLKKSKEFIPDWFQPSITTQVKKEIDSKEVVYLYMPWIEEHGNTLIEKIASDEYYSLVPFDIVKGVDPQEQRREVFRFAKQYPHVYKKMVAKRLIPIKNDISAFIFTFDWAPVMRIIAQVCKELNIPTILIPHESVFVDKNKYYWDPHANASVPVSDLILGWGDMQRDIFISRGYPAGNIISVGAPKFDLYKNYKPSLTREQYYNIYGLDPSKKTILFASQPLDSQLDTKVARESQRNAILDLFEFIKYNDAQLIVRLPPSKDNILDDSIVTLFDESGIAAIDDSLCYVVGPEESLYHVDIVTSINSTMLFEGVLCGKPAFSMKYVEFKQIWKDAGIPAVHNAAELKNILPSMLKDEWNHPQTGMNWAAKQFGVGVFDGNACVRIRQILEDYSQGEFNIKLLSSPLLRLANKQALDFIGYSSSQSFGTNFDKMLIGILSAQKVLHIETDKINISQLASADILIAMDDKVDAIALEASRKLSIPILMVSKGIIGIDGKENYEEERSIPLSFSFFEKNNDKQNRILRKAIVETKLENKEASNKLIDDFIKKDISRFSSFPMMPLEIGRDNAKKIIVFDNGLLSKNAENLACDAEKFLLMLNNILSVNINSDILLVREPIHNKCITPNEIESIIQKNFSFVNEQTTNRIIFTDLCVHPKSYIELADSICVIDSMLGFEALLHRKKVICYGKPLYSGWGLTEDMLTNFEDHIELEVLFYWLYVKLSRYVSGSEIIEINTAMGYIDEIKNNIKY